MQYGSRRISFYMTYVLRTHSSYDHLFELLFCWQDAGSKARMMLSWDVNNGVSILFKHIFFPTRFMCFLSRGLDNYQLDYSKNSLKKSRAIILPLCFLKKLIYRESIYRRLVFGDFEYMKLSELRVINVVFVVCAKSRDNI